MKRTIIKEGSCLAPWQIEANLKREEGHKMNFILTDDGILTISGNSHLCPIPSPNATPFYDEPDGEPCGWSEYISQFKDMDFHTVIIEDGVKVLDEQCFKDCKGLKKIVLPAHVPTIRSSFADGTSLEYTLRNNLKFLGSPSHPLYSLMGATDDFCEENLIIPEGTVRIADEAFKNKKSLKAVVFPESLEFLGWYTFEGTSIKELFIPEGELADEETLIAFDGEGGTPLETISLPYSMYKSYKEGMDAGMVEAWNRTCRIIYRNPDDSIAEILDPHPLDYNSSPDETMESPIETDSDELPF